MYRSSALFTISVFLFPPKNEPLCGEVKLFEKANFPIGVAINTDKLKNEKNYWTNAMAQFNSFTPEKIMKANYIHPKKDFYYFTETDHLADFCKQNKIRLHGHTLIWHKELPQWMEKFKGSPTEWDALMKDHIQTIIYHCKGYVRSWDVVNEAFNEDGSLTKNIWLKNIGEAYIEKAYRYALEADSSAIFFYNDFSLEKNGQKLSAVLKFFSALRSKGIKIDGIGMQMHVSLDYPYISDIDQAAMAIQERGFLVHYSELDISLSGDGKIFASSKRLLRLQKQRTKLIVGGYLKLNPKNRFGITVWGVSDNDSWLTDRNFRARPLLYDNNYKIKSAYCGFLEALTE